jgi:hypothetical protein
MQEGQNNNERKKTHLLRLGSELLGGGGSAAVSITASALIGGPGGAIAAALLNGVATPLITEFAKRLLTDRQKARVGATFILAKSNIEQKIATGTEPNKEFFEDLNNDGRPEATEVWEGILLSAQNEYQEKKISYYANLMANMAFEKDFDRARANFLIKLADSLSYRQLCLLAIFAGQQIKNSLRQTDYRSSSSNISQSQASVLHEILELFNLGILSLPNDTLLGITDVVPARMHVQGAGVELGRLMELNKIPNSDLLSIAPLLT